MSRANEDKQNLKDGLAPRAKIGVLVPATNTIVQPEYEAMRPRGVTNHVSRMTASGRDTSSMDAYRKSLERGSEHVKAAIELVVPCAPAIIALGHSIDTFRGGVAGAKALERELTAAAQGIPVVLPSLAFLAALEAYGRPRRVAAVTPYFPPGDEQVRSFFEDAGFEVTGIIGLKRPNPLAIAATPTADVVDALNALTRDGPEIILQPGTNLATCVLADQAETWLGVPVVSCNASTYWHTLRQLGIKDQMDGFGRLLSRH
jgi:maleate isomerase